VSEYLCWEGRDGLGSDKGSKERDDARAESRIRRLEGREARKMISPRAKVTH
jgi:hypothetical protein